MKIYFKSFILSILISVFLLLIFSVFLSITPLNEKFMPTIIIIISSVSILIGGYFIGKYKKTKGIVYGSIFGLSYMTFFYIISSIVNLNFSINFLLIIIFLAGICSGTIGGIMGVNL